MKSDLTAPVAGLPQSEPSLKVTYVQPKDFNGLLKYVRNILIVTVDPAVYTKTSLAYEANRWAKNQMVVTLRTPDETSILSYLEQNGEALSNFFVKGIIIHPSFMPCKR